MKRKNILLLMLSFVLLLVMIPTAVYAWFSRGDNTPMGFEMLEINSTVTLYQCADENRNGVPELAASPVDMKYYREIYDFFDPVTEYARSEENQAAVQLSFSAKELLPGRISTCKFAIENNSDTDNEIRMELDFGQLSAASSAELLRTLSVQVIPIRSGTETEGYPLDTAQAVRLYLCDLGESATAELFSLRLAGSVTAAKTGNGAANCYDFWLQVRMESLEAVNTRLATVNAEREAAGLSALSLMTEETYNALAGTSVENIRFRIYFDVTSDTIAG